MSREKYTPGAAFGASIHKDGEKWTLMLVRELRHPPEKVWKALTDPEHLRQWSPFDANRNLGSVGAVELTTVGAPDAHVAESQVTRAEPHRLLEYGWGGNDVRWELEPIETGTRLRLWHRIPRGFISMGAAGRHICLDVLERWLSEGASGRIVGGEAMKFGWPRLNEEYAAQFGVPVPR